MEKDPRAPFSPAFTPLAKQALERSLKEAVELEDNSISTEHILLALVSFPEELPAHVLGELGAQPARVRSATLSMHGLFRSWRPGGTRALRDARGAAVARLAPLSEEVRVPLAAALESITVAKGAAKAAKDTRRMVILVSLERQMERLLNQWSSDTTGDGPPPSSAVGE